jgi:pimeloyl-ACP methyl ester carboxylesterase
VTLVLLHAFPLDSRLWKHQQAGLGSDFQILAPNLPGAPIDAAADVVVELLDRDGLAKAAIAGISRGGYIAMSLARRYPERVSALILMDTRATPADEKEKEHWAVFLDRLGKEGIGIVPEIMLPRLITHQCLAGPVTEIILSQDPESVAAAARGMMKRPDARPFLRDVRAPTLGIAGVDDAAFESTLAIANAISGAAFLAVPGAGHLSNLEQPEIVNEAIRRFLNPIDNDHSPAGAGRRQ